MSEIKPKKSDPYDPKPVIKYAAQKAVKSGKDCYIIAVANGFEYSATQPNTTQTHWKLDHLAELYAHFGGLDITGYFYEKV